MEAIQPHLQQATQPQYSVSVPSASAPPQTLTRHGASAYPSLMDFMGLELTDEVIRLNMPEYASDVAVPQSNSSNL